MTSALDFFYEWQKLKQLDIITGTLILLLLNNKKYEIIVIYIAHNYHYTKINNGKNSNHNSKNKYINK